MENSEAEGDIKGISRSPPVDTENVNDSMQNNAPKTDRMDGLLCGNRVETSPGCASDTADVEACCRGGGSAMETAKHCQRERNNLSVLSVALIDLPSGDCTHNLRYNKQKDISPNLAGKYVWQRVRTCQQFARCNAAKAGGAVCAAYEIAYGDQIAVFSAFMMSVLKAQQIPLVYRFSLFNRRPRRSEHCCECRRKVKMTNFVWRSSSPCCLGSRSLVWVIPVFY
ncbi:uncharacterized protein LOC129588975 isoform X1 [Paramacrobiotus metropolitanus]|uniref:uncharacterized protein LOC129588975 isoform X1 n=1 Tax=Paramacrobiotus metropolitanus TaxID=2943436 RepID=UPI0024465060|nr:uncharacterized protein LOC129588975 isoform X1 [Paramacrobiotus metropolitanus]